MKLKNIISKKGLTAFLFCVLAILIIYGHGLFTNLTYQAANVDEDVINSFRPFTHFQFDYLKEYGQMPDFIYRAGNGYPAASEAQLGEHYPIRKLFLAISDSPGTAADLLIVFHMLIGCGFIFALARLYGISTTGAAISAISLATAKLTILWAPFYHAPVYFAAFPMAIFGIELIFKNKRLLGFTLTTLGIYIAIVGAHLQSTFLMMHFLGLLTLYRFFTQDMPYKKRVVPLAITASATLAGLVLGAKVLIPFIMLQMDSSRQLVLSNEIVPFGSISSMFFASGNDANGDLYLGITSSILAFIGIFAAIRKKYLAVIPLAILTFIIIGSKGSLFYILAKYLPGWAVMSNIARVSFVIVPLLCISAGLGFDAIAKTKKSPLALAIFASIFLATLLSFYQNIYFAGYTNYLVIFDIIAIYLLYFKNPFISVKPDKRLSLAIIIGVSLTILLICIYNYARFINDFRLTTSLYLGLLIILAVVYRFRKSSSKNLFSKSVICSIIALNIIGILDIKSLYQDRFENYADFVQKQTVKKYHENQFRHFTYAAEDKPLPRQQGMIDILNNYSSKQDKWSSFCIKNYKPSVFLEAKNGDWFDRYSSFTGDRYNYFWSKMVTVPKEQQLSYAHWNQHFYDYPLPDFAMMNLAGINKIMADKSCAPDKLEAIPSHWQKAAENKDYIAYTNTAAFPRAYISKRWQRADDYKQIIDNFASQKTISFDAHTDHTEALLSFTASDTAPSPIEFQRIDADSVEFIIPQNDSGLLVFTDNYYKGWHAFDQNAKELKVIPVNGLFIGAEIPHGTTKVLIRYSDHRLF